jgi:hypothetical protein
MGRITLKWGLGKSREDTIKFTCNGVRWCGCVLRLIKSRIPRKFLNMKLIENTQEKDPAQDVNNKGSIGTD